MYKRQTGISFAVAPVSPADCARYCTAQGVDSKDAALYSELTDQIPPAAAHTGHGDGFPDDAGLDLAEMCIRDRTDLGLTGLLAGAIIKSGKDL